MRVRGVLIPAILSAIASAAFGRGGGGCLEEGTPILTPSGTVPIRDVRPGDELLAFNAEGGIVRATVRGIISHEVREHVIVTTERAVLRVTAEHPFYVGEGTFKTLEALRVGDAVFACDGQALRLQRITGLERVRGPVRVYNLQTDAPHTFFAAGIAVHNKGGGGGGGGGHGGGGGFHGGSRGGGSSGGGSGDPAWVVIVVAVFIGMIVLISVLNRKTKKDQNLDFVYSPAAVERKARRTGKLLEFIAKTDSTVAPDALRQVAQSTFVKLQECWQGRDYGPMKPLMMGDLYAQHCAQIAGMVRNHEINVIADLNVERVDIVNVRYTHKADQREFTALITAGAKDYYMDDRTRKFLRGDEKAARFQEFWTFHRQGDAWLLREIEQSRESDALKDENFFEAFTNRQLQQLYAETAGAEGPAGPWLEKEVETKATRIEKMLGFLVQTDKLWDRQGMIERARQVFTNVHLTEEAGEESAVKGDELFPELADLLKEQIRRRKAAGITVEYRNLCIRKVELILARNFTDSANDEFTARISAHAQRILRKNGQVTDRQEYVTPFEEYWTFGRLDRQWKLKEVLPPSRVQGLVAQENLDQDSSPDQLQWYYRQERAV